MLKRPHYIALVLVGLLTLIVLNLPPHAANQIKLAIGGLFLPLFGLSKSTQTALNRAGDLTLTRSELLHQNAQLRQTNEELQVRVMQADTLLHENDRFRELLGWQKLQPWKLHLAAVIARDPANWWHVIQIDAGSRDGIQTNQPVMTSDGLVGRVSAVNLTTAQVSLIGNPDCKVAAVVEKTGDTGIITGSASPVDNSLVTLSYLASNTSLKPGQNIVTSGEGKMFPRGIVIGKIEEDSHQAELGYTEARVKLSANLGALEEVWVLLK